MIFFIFDISAINSNGPDTFLFSEIIFFPDNFSIISVILLIEFIFPVPKFNTPVKSVSNNFKTASAASSVNIKSRFGKSLQIEIFSFENISCIIVGTKSGLLNFVYP